MEDNDLLSRSSILNTDWLRFGCIQCIQSHCDYDDLLKPIEIKCERIGVITIVKGLCCNGHQLQISAHKSKRVYDRKARDILHSRPHREKYISYDTNILLTMASYFNGSGETALQRFVHALGIRGNFQKMYHTVSKAFLSPIIIKGVEKR